MEGRSQPPFEEADWLELQKRLDRHDKRRPFLFAWWWLALPVLLLLLGMNGAFFLELQKARQTISSVELRKDSVMHTRVIYIRDTIYRTRVVHEWVSAPLERNDVANARQTAQAANENPLVASKEYIRENQPVTANFMPLPLRGTTVFHYRRPAPALPEAELEPPIVQQRKALRYYLYDARPKGFQLGCSGGWAYPSGMDLNLKPGYSAGLQAAVEFSPKLRMWVDATYFNTRLVSNRMGDDLGIPLVSPPSDDYVFLRAEKRQPAMQYSAGMQYLFRSKRTFKPFLGLGYGAVAGLPYDITYEFENSAIGLEWNYDFPGKRSAALSDFLMLRAGFEYKLSTHWNWQMLAHYRSNLERAGSGPPDIFGIQSGLNYRF